MIDDEAKSVVTEIRSQVKELMRKRAVGVLIVYLGKFEDKALSSHNGYIATPEGVRFERCYVEVRERPGVHVCEAPKGYPNE